MTIVRIALLGVVGCLLALQFKSGKSEYGIYLSVGVSLVLFFFMGSSLEVLVDTVETLSSYISIDSVYVETMLKMLGETYLAEFASGICKDAGYQTIAGQIEIFAKLTILVLSMPVLLALLQTIQEFLR